MGARNPKIRTWAAESSVLYQAVEGRPEPRIPLVALRQATIYRHALPTGQDNSSVKPLFPRLSFSIDADKATKERWAVITRGDPLIRTQFLQSLQGQFDCVPTTARCWPYLASNELTAKDGVALREPSQAIRYVGFSNQNVGAGSSGTRGAYLAARYESRRESTDWSLLDYLRGTVSLNLSEEEKVRAHELEKDPAFGRVVQDFNLGSLLHLPVGNLSNGQTRRARIAKAVLKKPELLLLDEPFAGLDPVNAKSLSQLLFTLAQESKPRMILSLGPRDVPKWITHVIHLELDGTVIALGDKDEVYRADKELAFYTHVYGEPPPKRKYSFEDPEKERQRQLLLEKTVGRVIKHEDRMHKSWPEREQYAYFQQRWPEIEVWQTPPDAVTDTGSISEPLVEMEGVQVKYGNKCVLGDWTQEVQGEKKEGFHWQVKQGERWGVFGPNGSGKTTLISLLTSDHPQAYSLPLKIFGRSRLPTPGQPGLSVFDLQSRIGHSSPEVHTYFPKHFSIRQTLESAWADAFHSKPTVSYQNDKIISAALEWFRKELDPSYATKTDPLDVMFKIRAASEPLVESWQRQTTSKRKMTARTAAYSSWYNSDAEWADAIKFSDLSLSAQRVALFLRATIKKPDIVVLDEAFSGMDEGSRMKCMLFLAHGDQKWLRMPYYKAMNIHPKVDSPLKRLNMSRIGGLEPRQALICVSHRQEELPFVVDSWLRLPEANEGKPVVFGKIDRDADWWADIWGTGT